MKYDGPRPTSDRGRIAMIALGLSLVANVVLSLRLIGAAAGPSHFLWDLMEQIATDVLGEKGRELVEKIAERQ